VDQAGNLLTARADAGAITGLDAGQLDYLRQIETYYSQRIEARDDIGGHPRVTMPDIGYRKTEIPGKRSGPVNADPAGFVAQMSPSSQAIAAAAANQVTLS